MGSLQLQWLEEGGGDTQGVPAPQDTQGVPAPQDTQGVPAPQDTQGVPAPQDTQGVPAPQDTQGVPAPQVGVAHVPCTSSELAGRGHPSGSCPQGVVVSACCHGDCVAGHQERAGNHGDEPSGAVGGVAAVGCEHRGNSGVLTSRHRGKGDHLNADMADGTTERHLFALDVESMLIGKAAFLYNGLPVGECVMYG